MYVALFTRITERPLRWGWSQNSIIVLYKNKYSWQCDIYKISARSIATLHSPFKASSVNSLRTVLGYILRFNVDMIFVQGIDWSMNVEREVISVLGEIEISLSPLVIVPDCSEINFNDN